MIRWLVYGVRCLLSLVYPEHDERFASPCDGCKGAGRIDGAWCSVCNGHTWTQTEEQRVAWDDWKLG